MLQDLKDEQEITQENDPEGRVIPNDSEFDDDLKSIDDTTLNTSDQESPSIENYAIETEINWEDLDIDDVTLETEHDTLQHGQELYGEFSKSKAERVEELLMRLEIERIIPKRVAEQTLDFTKPILEYETVKDIKREYEITKTTDVSLLNTSIFVQTSLQALDHLKEQNLTNEQRKKLEDLRFLLTRIGNIKVNESDMLLKIIESN